MIQFDGGPVVGVDHGVLEQAAEVVGNLRPGVLGLRPVLDMGTGRGWRRRGMWRDKTGGKGIRPILHSSRSGKWGGRSGRRRR